jgi:predicted metalloendopeptidase
MKWRALDEMASLLTGRFEQEQFRFNDEVLSGQKEMRPRWMRCSDAVAGQPGADRVRGARWEKSSFSSASVQTRKRGLDELIAALRSRSDSDSPKSIG